MIPSLAVAHAGFEEVVPIVVVVAIIIARVIQASKGNAKKSAHTPRPRPRVRPQGRPAGIKPAAAAPEQELRAFLDSLSQNAGAKKPTPPPLSASPRTPPPLRTQQQQQQRPGAKQTPRTAPRRVAARRLEPEPPPVRTRKPEPEAEPTPALLSPDAYAHDVPSAPPAFLHGEKKSKRRGTPLVDKALESPEGIRAAFILSEILQAPISLRQSRKM